MNRKRQAFVGEYLKDFNATQAALRAGYSPRTARQQASILLTKQDISAAVHAAADKARSDAIMTLAEAQQIATTIGRNLDAAYRDRLAALDRLAKFNAWDAAAKLDITSGGKPLRTEIVLSATEPEPAETGEQA